jgi:hypothetical protein
MAMMMCGVGLLRVCKRHDVRQRVRARRIGRDERKFRQLLR